MRVYPGRFNSVCGLVSDQPWQDRRSIAQKWAVLRSRSSKAIKEMDGTVRNRAQAVPTKRFPADLSQSEANANAYVRLRKLDSGYPTLRLKAVRSFRS